MGQKLRDEDLVLNIIVNGDHGKKEIGKLERTIKDTRIELQLLEKQEKAMIRANKQDTQAYRELKAAIDAKNASIDKAKSGLVELRKGMDITKFTMLELSNEQKKLSALLRVATPGSAQWKQYNTQLLAVKTRIRTLREESKVTTAALNGMASRVQRFMGTIAAVLTTFYAAATGIRRATDSFISFNDKVADVQKTTGLAKDEVLELNEALKDTEVIDTRSAQENLLGLGRIAGKLGIDGKENILGFIKAADEISVALTEDLGGDVEKSINTLGKLVDVFEVTDEFGIETAMRKTGSLINELGANSSAAEEEVVDFLSRLAGIGPSANISMANLAGLGSTLSQLKQRMEVAGTTFVNLIPKMFGDTATFANIAGMEVEEFSDLLHKDANEALIRTLEGIRGNNGAMEEMIQKMGDIGLEGSRAKNILTVMANNTDKLRAEQILANAAFQEGTSITDEFTVKNTNAAAQLDKSKKAVYNMWVELGERLYPVLIQANFGFATLLSIIKSIIGFFIDYKKEITVVTTALVTYTIVLKAAILWQSRNIALIKAQIIWEKGRQAALLLSAAAQAIFTGKLTRASAAMKIFNAVTKLNPWVLLASLIIAAGSALVLYSKRLTSAEKAQKKLLDVRVKANEAIADQKTEIEQLLRIAKSKHLSDQTRIDAIKKLNEISPEYLGNLSLETINTEEAKKATDDYVKSLIKKAKAQAILDELKEIEKKRINEVLKGEASELSLWEKYLTLSNGLLTIDQKRAIKQKEYLEGLNSEQAALEKLYDTLLQEQTKPNNVDSESDDNTSFSIKGLSQMEVDKFDRQEKIRQKQIEKARQKQLEDQQKFREKILLESKSLIEQENHAFQERLRQAGLFGKSRERLTQSDLAVLETLELQHKTNIAKIDADAIQEEIGRKEDQFKAELDILHIAQNNELAAFEGTKEERKKLIEKHGIKEAQLMESQAQELVTILQEVLDTEQWEGITSDDILSDEEKAELEAKINELKLKLSELGIKSNEDPDKLETGKDLLDGKVDILGFSQNDWELFFENVKEGKLGIDELQFAALALTEAFKLQNQALANAENRRLQEFEHNVNNKKEKLKEQFDRGIIDQQQYSKEVERLDNDLDRKKAKIAYEQAKRQRNVALMSAIVNTAAGVARAFVDYKWPYSMIVGGIVGAAGAIQIGTISSTPLPSIPGREDGGFIDVRREQDGHFFRAKNDPEKRGYVHGPTVITGEDGTELVASNAAYQNPTIRPVLDAIDTAQRNGTISTINLMKLLSDRPGVQIPGRQTGGYVYDDQQVSPAEQTQQQSNDRADALLEELLSATRELNNNIANGIKADVSLLGKKGFYESQSEYESLQKQVNI